ncbi:aminotransferase class I/II-fold pyridoxal phosphate-dependent enzyme [Helcococcus ovis]|uniref:Aminotransferase class I/II-fold pyridoxal phosphate-dependent enzyme n=1 Tax=Helcococcus ovis TaxID=72026 RepID=A0A4R9C0B5_9FIRM|nr:aminotransferase class I/II-fold pyridoxal phosphate-dependent enzyme [Helcococcus ovis]TFF65124.1 aminotransferase class I/II-fold pyridoxal phosphate-dependent enzyme [Helcococcus ovis]TFF66367.1 aminotransferase class I/II-fold pyridoxal phosphate-dependent enzyme [Helcococcus ovis]
MEEIKKITDFENSREFGKYMQMVKGVSEILETFGNPYFVPHDSALTDKSIMNGKEVLNFGSYNYLCLSGDPEVNQAAKEAVDKYGTSASGSRLLAGEKTLHKELEKAIAEWKHTEDAIVLVGGHSTNVTFVGNFCNENDLILYDILMHNSVTEGIRMSSAKAKRFKHNDYEMLERLVEKNRDKYEKILIIAEGVYSMDGDIAPIDEYVRIKKKYGCFLMVDEAHSACVIGENGKGVDEYFNLDPNDIDIKMGTLSKGLGTCGGYLAGKHSLIEYLRYSLPGFVFSVGISPVLAAATKKSVELIQRDNSRVKSLQSNIKYFIEQAKLRGLDTCLAKESAIIPIYVGDESMSFKLSMELQDEGIFVPPAVYPAVPKKRARLRFCLTSGHTFEQIQYTLDKVQELMKKEGLL